MKHWLRNILIAVVALVGSIPIIGFAYFFVVLAAYQFGTLVTVGFIVFSCMAVYIIMTNKLRNLNDPRYLFWFFVLTISSAILILLMYIMRPNLMCVGGIAALLFGGILNRALFNDKYYKISLILMVMGLVGAYLTVLVFAFLSAAQL